MCIIIFFFFIMISRNPNGDCSEIIWAPLTKENAQYLEIGNNSLEMHTGWPNYERMQFLDELYPIPQTNV